MVADPLQGRPGAVGAAKIATALRAWSGDMSNIRVPAKWAARLGQCFSSTLDAARVEGAAEVGQGCAVTVPLLKQQVTDSSCSPRSKWYTNVLLRLSKISAVKAGFVAKNTVGGAIIQHS